MKREEMRKFLRENNLDAIVLFNKCPSFSYFIGGDFEHGIMVLAKDQSYLFLSPLYNPKAPGFKVVHWKKFKEDFKAFIKEKKIKTAGIDYNNITIPEKRFLSKHFRTKDVSRFLSSLRVTKLKDEIEKIRRACKVTDDIFNSIINAFNFESEEDIAKHIKIKAIEAGCEMAFEPIVASGANAAIAHHDSKGKLNRGFLVLDFGAKYRGYCSDMTRTIFLGRPTAEEKRTYEKVLCIQEECIDKARVGLRAGELFDHSIRLFGKDAKYFIHGLGHGFGIEIHELPSISMKSKDTLEKGTVFTIEPGYYDQKKGIGIRIEDDIYLGGKKEVLTKSPKELIMIDFH